MQVQRRKRAIKCICSIPDGQPVADVGDSYGARLLRILNACKSSLRATSSMHAGNSLLGSPLALDPRQAGLAPATQRAPMTLRVLVAFETFKNVEGAGVPRGSRRARGAVRAVTTPAQEEHRSVAISDSALQGIEEAAVSGSAGVGVPLDELAARYPAHVVPLGAGPHVDKASLRQANKQGTGFYRRHCTEIGQKPRDGALPRCIKNIFDRAGHGPCDQSSERGAIQAATWIRRRFA